MSIEKLKELGNPDNSVTTTVLEFFRQVRLAGLGAASKISREGGKIIEDLIKEGEAVEARFNQPASTPPEAQATPAEATAAEPTTSSKNTELTDKDMQELESIFEDRVARALGRMEVPTHEDYRNLNREIDNLGRTIASLKQAIGN